VPQSQVSFVNDSPLQSTLRELQGLSRDARFWTVLAVIALIVGLVGPFGTYQVLAVAPRLAYWGVVVLGTALTGTLVVGFIERLLRPRLNKYLAALLAGALPGPLLAAMVALINIAVFGPGVTSFDLLTLGIYCTLISAAVTLVSAVLERPITPAATPEPPALLERLPRPQRGPLRRISVADHYVEVTTDKGSSLVLMRLSDAIKETAPIEGLQVHRSHWVALDAVRRSTRQNGRPALELDDGTIVPVSRTYIAAVRAAGFPA
jgi:DNA-binding LytR/AlgR family response regulator